jgi:hypothetical protein
MSIRIFLVENSNQFQRAIEPGITKTMARTCDVIGSEYPSVRCADLQLDFHNGAPNCSIEKLCTASRRCDVSDRSGNATRISQFDSGFWMELQSTDHRDRYESLDLVDQ